jgi:hypothetical protein
MLDAGVEIAMPVSRPQFPVLLTQAQRKAVALLLPDLADRLKLDENNQRTIPPSLAELKEIRKKAPVAVRQAESGMVRNSLPRAAIPPLRPSHPVEPRGP